MKIASQIAPRKIYQRSQPVRNAGYRRFIKSHPCIGCGATRLVDPAHTGPHPYGQKSSDMTVLPMCRKCHLEFDADPQGFTDLYNLDVPAEILKFNQLWDARQKRTA